MQKGFQSITQTNKKGFRAFTDFLVKPQTSNRVQRSLNRYHKVFAEAFIFDDNNSTAQKFSTQQERLLKILALNNSTDQKISSQCSNFEQLPESSVQILSSQDIDVSDEFAQILSNEVLHCSKFEQSNNSTAQKFSTQQLVG